MVRTSGHPFPLRSKHCQVALRPRLQYSVCLLETRKDLFALPLSSLSPLSSTAFPSEAHSQKLSLIVQERLTFEGAWYWSEGLNVEKRGVERDGGVVTLVNDPKTGPTVSEVIRKFTIAPYKNEDFYSLHQHWGGEQNPL